MKSKLVEQLYERKDILTLCKNFCQIKNLHEDLHQELFIILFKMSDTKLNEINDRAEIEIFIKGILRNMCSKTGQFFKKYILPEKLSVEHIAFDENGNEISTLDLLSNDINDLIYEGLSKETKHIYLEAMEKVLEGDTIYPFDRRVLKAKLKHGSNHNTALAEGLNKRFVHESVQRAKQKLKEGIEKEIQ